MRVRKAMVELAGCSEEEARGLVPRRDMLPCLSRPQVSSRQSDLERVGWSVGRTRQSYHTVRRPLLVVHAVMCLMPCVTVCASCLIVFKLGNRSLDRTVGRR